MKKTNKNQIHCATKPNPKVGLSHREKYTPVLAPISRALVQRFVQRKKKTIKQRAVKLSPALPPHTHKSKLKKESKTVEILLKSH